jgi:hypothetical protein
VYVFVPELLDVIRQLIRFGRNTLRNKPNNIQNRTEQKKAEEKIPQNKGRPVIRERHMYETMTK